jgi:hypothetical protein
MLQGNSEGAFVVGEEATQGVEPRSFVGWASAMAGRLSDLAALGRLEEALQQGISALSYYDARDRELAPFFTSLIANTAQVEAILGDCNAGARRIDEYLAELGDEDAPTVIGTLCEARARIALRAGDLPTARRFGQRTRQAFAPTGNPVLIARTERLQRELDAGVFDLRDTRTTLDLDAPLALQSAPSIARAATRKERYQRALALLVTHVGGGRAALYEHVDGALSLRAGVEAGGVTHARALDELQRHAQEDEVTVASSTTDASSEVETRIRVESAWRSYVLALGCEDTSRVVAVACIEQVERVVREPSPALLEALARALAEGQADLHADTPIKPSFPPVTPAT